jgi:hypothetical protein
MAKYIIDLIIMFMEQNLVKKSINHRKRKDRGNDENVMYSDHNEKRIIYNTLLNIEDDSIEKIIKNINGLTLNEMEDNDGLEGEIKIEKKVAGSIKRRRKYRSESPPVKKYRSQWWE